MDVKIKKEFKIGKVVINTVTFLILFYGMRWAFKDDVIGLELSEKVSDFLLTTFSFNVALLMTIFGIVINND